jgi:histone-binding protein RBBP4
VTQPVHGGDYVEHKLLLGTHVDPDAVGRDDRNYLIIATVRLPSPDAELKVSGFDEERGELGGYGGSLAKVEISVKINHPTEVNRARYNPGNPFLIATKTASSDVLLFDYSKHPSLPTDDVVRETLRLTGHKKEGYGIAWSPHAKNLLLSGSDDGLVCCWDVAGGLGGGGGAGAGAGGGGGARAIKPTFMLEAHAAEVVEDVAWHASHPDLFGSVSDDKELRLWDARNLATPTARVAAHKGEAMALSFHPTKEHLVATGGTDKVVRIWDSRNLAKGPLHNMLGHDGDVLGVAWSPFSEAHLASSGQDRRVMIWDVEKIGNDQSPEDADDGPPELLVRAARYPPPPPAALATLNRPLFPTPTSRSLCTAATRTASRTFPGTKRKSGSLPASRTTTCCRCGSPRRTCCLTRTARAGRRRRRRAAAAAAAGGPAKSRARWRTVTSSDGRFSSLPFFLACLVKKNYSLYCARFARLRTALLVDAITSLTRPPRGT